VQAGEVQIVGGLVEQHDVEAGEQHGGQAGLGRLATREAATVELGAAFLQSDRRQRGADPASRSAPPNASQRSSALV
jgi:hypothetical protein